MKTHKFNSENIGKMEDMIAEATFSASLSDFDKGIKKIIAYAGKNDLDMEAILNELFQSIKNQYFADLEDTRYQLLQNDSAVRMFLYADWAAFRKENASLSDVIYMDKLLLEISHSKDIKIDNGKAENCIRKLMEAVQAEIDILDVLPDKHSVNIAFVDQAETRYEGYIDGHMPFLPERTYHHIIVSNFTDDKTDTERIHGFMKAIGCVYLFSLTGSFARMPKGFFAIKKLFSSKINSDIELFAECFAMALCVKPALKQYDVQPDIPLEIKRQIYEYMIGLGNSRSPTQFHIEQTKFNS